jgi:magnesium transporter
MVHHPNLSEILTDKIPKLSPADSIADVEQVLIAKAKSFDSINYLYVVDADDTLLGMVSVKELFASDKKTKVEAVMTKTFISAHIYTTPERLAYLALKHNVKAIPVVDDDRRLLGVVPSQEIQRILEHKAVAHIFRASGIKHNGMAYDDIDKLPLFKSLRHRLPWLLLGLAGGLVTAGIVGSFEEVLSRNLILAAFIPLIVYMADAVGTQMEAFIIRDMAVNPAFRFPHYFARQMGIVLTIDAVISSVFFALSYALYGDERVSVVLALALFFAIFSSLVSGLVIPFLFSRMRLDPANASGPIATIVQDILSVLVYFLIATWLL